MQVANCEYSQQIPVWNEQKKISLFVLDFNEGLSDSPFWMKSVSLGLVEFSVIWNDTLETYKNETNLCTILSPWLLGYHPVTLVIGVPSCHPGYWGTILSPWLLGYHPVTLVIGVPSCHPGYWGTILSPWLLGYHSVTLVIGVPSCHPGYWGTILSPWLLGYHPVTLVIGVPSCHPGYWGTILSPWLLGYHLKTWSPFYEAFHVYNGPIMWCSLLPM